MMRTRGWVFTAVGLMLCIGIASAQGAVIAHTSFEDPGVFPNVKYFDVVGIGCTPVPCTAVDHALVNNAGEPYVNWTGGAEPVEIGFTSYYTNSRNDVGLTDGDYVGPTDYTGSVGSYTDGTQGFQFSDCDGTMTTTFDTVVLSGPQPTVLVDVFVSPDDYELDPLDRIRIWVVLDPGAVEIDLMNTAAAPDPDIDSQGIEGYWIHLSQDLTGYTSATLKAELESNGSFEAMYLDNIRFLTDGAPGACCITGEACQEMTADDCATQSGYFQGAGTQCSPDPCTGACCVGSDCYDTMSHAECDANEGYWYQDQDCTDPDLCTIPDLIISEVADGTVYAGEPKFVEFYNTGATPIDLSRYSIGNFSDGSTYLGGSASTMLVGTLAPGDAFVYCYENPANNTFYDTYGFYADQYATGAWINGNHVIVLFDGLATGYAQDARWLDVYGVIGQSGWGQCWDYNDSYAYRLAHVVAPRTDFDCGNGEWSFAGADALEYGNEDQNKQYMKAVTSPGEHPYVRRGACCVVETCSIELEDYCTNTLMGEYKGDGTICLPNPCATATGACCIDDVCWADYAEDQCDLDNGTYMGDYIPCTPDPCIERKVIISEVVDGTMTAGQPKFVEITNVGDEVVNLVDLSLGNYSNGNLLLSANSTPLSGSLPPDSSYVFCYDEDPAVPPSKFEEVYGDPPDQYAGGGYINGNDVVVLFLGQASGTGYDSLKIDVYGEIGVDGTGTCWDYTDSYAYRDCVLAPTANFDCDDWTFGGPGALDLGGEPEDNLPLILANTTPWVYGECATCGGDVDDEAGTGVGDGYVNFHDVDTFAAELVSDDPDGPDPCTDVNGDCAINGEDIRLFVELVLANGGEGTPCFPPVAIIQCSDVGGPGPDCPDFDDYCHWTITDTAVDDWCVGLVPSVAVGNVLCLPCPLGECPAGDPEIFRWVNCPSCGGGDCYFEATPTEWDFCEECAANPVFLQFAYDDG